MADTFIYNNFKYIYIYLYSNNFNNLTDLFLTEFTKDDANFIINYKKI